MKTPALHQAIRLYKYPNEMEWLTFPESELPEGVTDLLRLCASPKKLHEFATRMKLKESLLKKVMVNFIEEVLLTTTNPKYKFIGLNHNNNDAERKLNYQLLMKIYHPDKNSSEDAADKASKITLAYQTLNKESLQLTPQQKNRDKADPRTPPNSFYKATSKAEQSLSQTRNTFYAMASLAFVSLLTLMAYVVQSSKPELMVQNEPTPAVIATTPYQLQNNLQVKPVTQPQPLLASTTNINDLEPHLEKLLHQLEESYELGKVENIEPILSNTPDISGQSTEQITAKLKSLFKITQERKMLLYGFSWKKVANTIQGEGKFLSRYQFTNENQWLTREGIAIIRAENKDKSLKIISLELNNNTIEQ
jgi:curved DNA-binding protein CbpA